MRIRLFAVIVALALMPAGVANAAPPKYRSVTVPLEAGRAITLSSAKGSVALLAHTRGAGVLGVSEQRYRYRVGPRSKPLATLWLTVRTLPTRSTVVFARLSAPRGAVPVTLALKSHARSYSVHDLHLVPSPAYDLHYGVDKTSGPWGWIELSTAGVTDRNVFISKAYRYKERKKTYAQGGTSTVKQLVSERSIVSASRVKGGSLRVSVGLAASKDLCERYFILSSRPIVTADATSSMVASVTASEAGWLDPNGTYKKAPYSIEPWTADGYVRSLLEMRADSLRAAYERTGAPLFEDLLLNNAYSLALIRPADGLWRTDYTSTWVKGESGIVAPYIDTRHNEGIALASTKIADALASHGQHAADSIRDWTPAYGQFLAGRAAASAVTTTTNGFYFADYYDASGVAKVHSSLNHSLGEMNYLLVQCGDSSATPLFDLAMKIKSAVDDSGEAWIAPNGDLWYQRDLNGAFEGIDYPTVTYFDLLNSQTLLERLAGGRDPILDELIASKSHYLGIGEEFQLAPSASTTATPSLRDSLGAAGPHDMRLP